MEIFYTLLSRNIYSKESLSKKCKVLVSGVLLVEGRLLVALGCRERGVTNQ